jgi:hypothetical protein
MENKYKKIKKLYMLNFVIYGHTDYLDVLQIQTDYSDTIKNKILFINKNNFNLESIYEKYNKVIFYDDSKSYPQRLSECLNQINDVYVLLCHDIDILINVNEKLISELHNFLVHNNFDRIDLKHSSSLNSTLFYQCTNPMDFNTWESTDRYHNDDKLYLIRQTNPSDYIYNVNPSIWKRETLLEIMNSFPHKNYRTIEDIDVQIFTQKYTIFKMFSQEKKQCGHFDCINDFMFFHITHNGSFVPFNNDYSTIYGQSYLEIKTHYENMVDKYNLRQSNKWKN